MLAKETETFASNDRLRVHQQNRLRAPPPPRPDDGLRRDAVRPAIRYIEYVADGKARYEVEHIWANHPERHTDEFAHPSDFAEHRNRIGGLLLLPKSFNASYGDLLTRRSCRTTTARTFSRGPCMRRPMSTTQASSSSSGVAGYLSTPIPSSGRRIWRNEASSIV